MSKNRLQRLKEDIGRDVQKQLDENKVDTTPKPLNRASKNDL